MEIKYIVEENNLTINYILKNILHMSSRLFNKLVKNHLIFCNNINCDTRSHTHVGDIITIDFNYEEDSSNIIAKEMNLDIVYEDEWLIIINKPRGISVHPSILHFDDSLANGIKFYFDKINLHKKIRPVNRLDLGTEGLIIFAKNEYIQECLVNQMNSNIFYKEYLALVEGFLKTKKGCIDKPIGRKKGSIIERCISPDGKKAITNYEVLKESNNYSLVKCVLLTGRTHQIRVHFSSIGHPLVGDTLYGKPSSLLPSQALLCYKIAFIHPISKKKLEFELKNSNFQV